MNSDISSSEYDIKQAYGKENLVPVLIIGSGPAGLSSALYTCRANIKTVVIEGSEPGGQLMKTTFIENWPGIKKILGSRAVSTVREQAELFGAEFFSDFVDYIDFSSWPFIVHTGSGITFHAMSVIISTGASPKYLGVPGEQKYWGSGVSICAICDAPFYKDENVVIIGGGDSAAEEAMQLAAYAKKVTVLVRKNNMRASQIMQEAMRGYPNITVFFNSELKEIYGDEMFVSGVKIYNNKTNDIKNYSTNGVFIAIGRNPNTDLFKDIIDLEKSGHIKLKGRSQNTSVQGIFAAGDVTDSVYRQAGVASGNGIKAALDAERFLISIGLNKIVTKKMEPYFFKSKFSNFEIKLESITNLKDFKKKVKLSDIPVVLDFYTESCPSCLQMLPKLAKVANDFSEEVKVYKVNAEEAMELAEALSVFKVPSIVVFRNGVEVQRKTIEMNRNELDELFQNILK